MGEPKRINLAGNLQSTSQLSEIGVLLVCGCSQRTACSYNHCSDCCWYVVFDAHVEHRRKILGQILQVTRRQAAQNTLERLVECGVEGGNISRHCKATGKAKGGMQWGTVHGQ